jgi:hypothetical protein
MRKLLVGLAVVALGAALPLSPVVASAARSAPSPHDQMVQYLRAHGYLPPMGATRYAAVKRRAAQRAGTATIAPAAASPHAPATGPSWSGVAENDLAPSDSTGAIGPNSYIEMINTQIAIYNRSGALIASAGTEALTGTAHSSLSDPQVMWDPGTNRFYYIVLNVSNDTIQWGFSKDSNPVSLPGGFCNYDADFGYGTSLPDYPKLGDTLHSLLIGVNVFQNAQTFAGADVDYITKPSGTAAITTCPASSTFKTGKASGLVAPGNVQASTPEPAQQDDASTTGWVVSTLNTTGSASSLVLFQVTENADGTPNIPHTGTSVGVAAYSPPPSAPQPNGLVSLDTLDGRLEHAVSAIDPAQAGATALWTAHAVAGGAGSEVRWYEINPSAAGLFQSGAATSSSLYAFNGAVAPDRGAGSFGCNMVLGFSTSSATSNPAAQMVSKVGTSPQSGFTLVRQSPGDDEGFDCLSSTTLTCRWGDYSGATSDPSPGTTGAVWLTNMLATGGGFSFTSAEWSTWNWRATP